MGGEEQCGEEDKLIESMHIVEREEKDEGDGEALNTWMGAFLFDTPYVCSSSLLETDSNRR